MPGPPLADPSHGHPPPTSTAPAHTGVLASPRPAVSSLRSTLAFQPTYRNPVHGPPQPTGTAPPAPFTTPPMPKPSTTPVPSSRSVDTVQSSPATSPSSPLAHTVTGTHLDPPLGWTNNEARLRIRAYRNGKCGTFETIVQELYGLPNIRLLLARKQFRDVMVLFQSSPDSDGEQPTDTGRVTYYIWNGVEQTMDEIKQPKDLKSIYEKIGRGGSGFVGDLRLEEVEEKDSEEI